MNDQKVLVIIPAYNESGNIGRVVREVRSSAVACDLVVVNDGSKDNTVSEARAAGAVVLDLPFNLGIGGAVQTGFRYAMVKGYDIACQFDGDGQHDAGFLNTILDPVKAGAADIVVGSRFVGPDLGWQSSLVRRWGIGFFSWLLSALTGTAVTDPTSGFRAFNREAIRVFAEDYPDDFPEPESVMSAKRYGLKCMEVPVKMRPRSHGHSSIRYFRTLYYMIKVTFAILLNRLKQRRSFA